MRRDERDVWRADDPLVVRRPDTDMWARGVEGGRGEGPEGEGGLGQTTRE
jgi:hypothetical protein